MKNKLVREKERELVIGHAHNAPIITMPFERHVISAKILSKAS